MAPGPAHALQAEVPAEAGHLGVGCGHLRRIYKEGQPWEQGQLQEDGEPKSVLLCQHQLSGQQLGGPGRPERWQGPGGAGLAEAPTGAWHSAFPGSLEVFLLAASVGWVSSVSFGWVHSKWVCSEPGAQQA